MSDYDYDEDYRHISAALKRERARLDAYRAHYSRIICASPTDHDAIERNEHNQDEARAYISSLERMLIAYHGDGEG